MANVSLVFLVDDFAIANDVSAKLLTGISKAFAERGVELTFKFTGQVAEYHLAQATREHADLRDELVKQDLGYAGSSISRPTLSEALVDADWQNGVSYFEQTQTAGFVAVSKLAGKLPSCYGSPFWVPQAFGVLNQWGTRATISRDSFLSDGDFPFFFGGRMNLSQLGHAWFELGRAIRAGETSASIIEAIQQEQNSLANTGGVIVCRLNLEHLNGMDVDSMPSVVTNFVVGVLDQALAISGLKVRSVRQVVDLLSDISYEHVIPVASMLALAEQAATGTIAPFAYSAGYLSPAEQLYLLVAAWDESHRKGKSVRNSTTRSPLGPTEFVDTDESVTMISADELSGVLARVMEQMKSTGLLPASVKVAQGTVGIQDFFPTIAAGFRDHAVPRNLPIHYGSIAETSRVDESLARTCWQHPMLPVGFASPQQLALTKLQMWTFKPVHDIANTTGW